MEVIKNPKRNSEFSKTNRIRLDLFSFEKNEIKEKQKQENDIFSFSTRINDEKIETKKVELEKVEPKFITKQISLDSKKHLMIHFHQIWMILIMKIHLK